VLVRYLLVFRRTIENVSYQDRSHHKNEQHCREREASSHEWPEMKRGAVSIIRQSRAQTKIKIRRRRDCAETADYLSQLRLLLIKLATRGTPSQVLHDSGTTHLVEHQLVEFLTNYFTIVFSHNFFTYK
jgi:hypothetical protein